MLCPLKPGPFATGVLRYISLAGRGAESYESIEVHGGAEGLHSEAARARNASRGDLPEGRDQHATYFNWKKKYGGLLPDEMRRLKALENENSQLKKIVTDLKLDREMLQDVIRRKL